MDDLIGLLSAAGAPNSLATPVQAALGPAAAATLTADPWRLLDVAGVRPAQADAFARAVLAAAQRDDQRRAAALACWHLRRAAADGHTALPLPVLAAALAADGAGTPPAVVEAACASGRVVARRASADAPPMLALLGLASAEEALAAGLVRLSAEARATVVAGPREETAAAAAALAETVAAAGVAVGTGAPSAGRVVRIPASDQAGSATARTGAATVAAAGLGAGDCVVVEDAELLDVTAAAALLKALPEEAGLVFAGDPALIAAGPGRVLRDVLAAEVLPVKRVASTGGGPLRSLVAAVREGRLPVVDDPTREVVVVPSDDAGAVARTVQLVSDSIPRVVGVPSGEVLVVTPRRGGGSGAEALDAALRAALGPRERPYARTAHQAMGDSASAVVVVLPAESAGSLTRALVATALSLARRHVSVVHAAGPALAEAVARILDRPCHTQLATLLGAAPGSTPGAGDAQPVGLSSTR